MAGARRCAFICVVWQVTLYDPIWQVTSRSSEVFTTSLLALLARLQALSDPIVIRRVCLYRNLLTIMVGSCVSQIGPRASA